jgi:predicted dehydrogenase
MRRRNFLAAAAAGALAAAAPGLYGQVLPRGRKVRIGVVGGGFGADFQWHLHPNSRVVAVCDLRDDRLKVLKETYRCDALYKDYKRLLKHRGLEAVAIFTPPHLHVPMALEALAAGKHVISAVPAGLSETELEQLLAAVKKSGLKYMMAETSRFRPDVLTCEQWAREGRFGTIFYSEAEYHHTGDNEFCYGETFDCQSCEHDAYKKGKFRVERGVQTWSCLPPMFYPTHATGLLIPVIKERFVEVTAMGWGDQHQMLGDKNYYKNPFWNSQAFFKTSGGHSARISVWWHAAAGHTERGAFYGDRMSYVMARPEGSPPVVIRQSPRRESQIGVYDSDVAIERFKVPDHREKLPQELRGVQAPHGNSHPFITHEFIAAIVENRMPAVDVREAIAYTLPGLVAHRSALQGGAQLKIPDLV